MKIFILVFFLSFLAGCGASNTLSSNQDLQRQVDLDAWLSLDSDAEAPKEKHLAQEEVDLEASKKSKNKKISEKQVVQSGSDQAPWTRDLDRAINRCEGKNCKRRRSLSDDVVRTPPSEEKEENEIVVRDIKPPQIDVLFVLDTSYSMHGILKSMPQKMKNFSSELKKADVRVAFIDAVYQKGAKTLANLEFDGALVVERKYITKQTKFFDQIFIDTLTRNKNSKSCAFPPGCGGRKERPLLSLASYLSSPEKSSYGAKFLRSEAGLAVVIVTDNKENNYRFRHSFSAAQVMDVVNSELPEDKDVSVHALTVLNQECKSQLMDEHFLSERRYAPEITLLTQQTEGSSWSLCMGDYSPVASEIVSRHTSS